jgi:hypothetical protein
VVRSVDAGAFMVILDAPEVHGRFDRRTPLQRILG